MKLTLYAFAVLLILEVFEISFFLDKSVVTYVVTYIESMFYAMTTVNLQAAKN
jgi:hypothetical protein